MSSKLALIPFVLVLAACGFQLRGSIKVPKAAGRTEIEELARANPNVQRFVAGQNVKKVVVVPGRLVNLVV